VFLYLAHHEDFCRGAKEMIRITKPGGTIFLSQINDIQRQPLRHRVSDGSAGFEMNYWYRFAHRLGIDRVRVVRGTEVYSQRRLPPGKHLPSYDLYAEYRYNVYFRKPTHPIDLDRMHCETVVSSHFTPRVTVSNAPCHLPFSVGGVVFDDCTNHGERRMANVRRDSALCCSISVSLCLCGCGCVSVAVAV